MKQQMGQFLQNLGYKVIPSNLPEFTIFFQVEFNFVNVIHLIEDKAGLYLTNDQYVHIKHKIYELFKDRGYENIHILSIILSEDMNRSRGIYKEDQFCWILQPDNKRLVVYERQAYDFYGLRTKIEDWLTGTAMEGEAGQQAADERRKNDAEGMKRKYINRITLPAVMKLSYVTIILTSINILVFLICTFTGELLYNWGALNAIKVLHKGEYYRLLTSMFLHLDIHHLFGNMIIFYFLGDIVERETGHGKYLLLFLLSGIGGSLLSMGYAAYTKNFIDSVGASGAIFGVVGALLLLVLTHKGKLRDMTILRVLFLIIYSMYSGFTGTDIDNAAHVGGLTAGFVLAMALCQSHNKIHTEEKRDIE